MCQKCFKERHFDLLLTEEENKKTHYVLIRFLNTFMYDHKLHVEETFFIIIACKLLAQNEC